MTDFSARRFIDALQRLEQQDDLDGIVSLFADDAELNNPTLDQPRQGPDGARHFWESYRHSFAEVRSTFRHVTEGDGAALMEWSSRGKLADGTPFEYDGVSVIEHDGQRVRGFRGYFDPARLQRRVGAAEAD